MTEQTGTNAPPEWYTKPPEWLTRPPQQTAPPPQQQQPPPQQHGNNNDLITAVNALPERVVNALRDAIQSAQAQSQNAQQQTGQNQQGNSNQENNKDSGTEQQQQPGPLTFGERWFTK
jgi:hypothetical protein